MRIKRIEINGFKSFADKTEIDMGDGLTAVVGPNGAGKSNLAEAVKWVLGEQSARILRGTRMDDVIFSGTAKRKSVGFAEVSLVFDNTQGNLPIDFNEVAITRRVYRSGDGEYYINRKLCRLKDITELFLDTGIGKDSYSFVGQGRIDEILSADPRERRAIFEEAAGISRYKLRKRETENRLHETEHNLRRVLDIASELENQLTPLSGEADRAREYLSLGEQRRIWEKELLLYEVGLADRQSGSLKTQIERTGDELLQQENTLTITENKRTAVSLSGASALIEIQDLEKNVYELKLLRQQRQERLIDINLELDKLRLQAQGYRNRSVQHQQDIENVQASLRQLTSEYDLRAEDLRKVQVLLAGLPTAKATEGEAYEDDVARSLLATERNANDLRAESLILGKRLTSLHEDISIKQRDQGARVHVLESLKTEEAVCSQQLEELGAKAANLQEQKRSESLRLDTLRQQHTKLGEQTQKLQAELFQAQNRLRALKSAEAQMEGLGRGARFVLGLKLPGVFGVVGNLVSTSQEFE
ncbi:MAG: AAA family ATPase, partial [Bacillota bacterium]|nr:AAA family ATPase [Bacillota bacterium]